MRKIVLLGSTGSVGRQALDVISHFRDRFEVFGLAAGKNLEVLVGQVEAFCPKKVAVRDKEDAESLRGRLKGVEVLWGEGGLLELAREDVDVVFLALTGSTSFLPAVEAVKGGRTLAIASKEALVMGGEVIMGLAKATGAKVLPVDSEHSALFQVLEGRPLDELERIFLTASGGPFYGKGPEETEGVTPEEALRHPVWSMGPKVSVDSATLMNKGLEVIEARWLFGIEPERIRVVLHPEGVVHGLVEFRDGVIMGHMAPPDMRIPIAYALSYPHRLPLPFPRLGVERLSGLTLREVSPGEAPALDLAYWALEVGGSMPAVLSAADEVAVEAFLRREIGFNRILEVVRAVMERHSPWPIRDPSDVLEAARWAEAAAREEVEGLR